MWEVLNWPPEQMSCWCVKICSRQGAGLCLRTVHRKIRRGATIKVRRCLNRTRNFLQKEFFLQKDCQISWKIGLWLMKEHPSFVVWMDAATSELKLIHLNWINRDLQACTQVLSHPSLLVQRRLLFGSVCMCVTLFLQGGTAGSC